VNQVRPLLSCFCFRGGDGGIDSQDRGGAAAGERNQREEGGAAASLAYETGREVHEGRSTLLSCQPLFTTSSALCQELALQFAIRGWLYTLFAVISVPAKG
jgi:hypothetical protein